jgi:hypothetical protein
MKGLAKPFSKIKNIYGNTEVSNPHLVQITGITPFIL